MCSGQKANVIKLSHSTVSYLILSYSSDARFRACLDSDSASSIFKIFFCSNSNSMKNSLVLIPIPAKNGVILRSILIPNRASLFYSFMKIQFYQMLKSRCRWHE